LTAWLRSVDLLPVPGDQASPGDQATAADHRLALDLRAGLRALALLNNGGPPDATALARARHALDRLPLAVQLPASPAATGEPGSPASNQPILAGYRQTPVRAALCAIVAGYARAVATGDWPRMRRCPAEDCAWVFWDSSAKGARRWCAMSICGNRAKTRAFARRRSARTA
jgi:CGNR zinc finger protein